MNLLDGNKTYLTGLLMIAMGIIQAMGFMPEGTLDSAGVQLGDPGMLISTGLGMIFLRSGVKKDATKAAQNTGDGQ